MQPGFARCLRLVLLVKAPVHCQALSFLSVWSDQLPREQTDSDFIIWQCLMRLVPAGFLTDTRHCLMMTSKSFFRTTAPGNGLGPKKVMMLIVNRTLEVNWRRFVVGWLTQWIMNPMARVWVLAEAGWGTFSVLPSQHFCRLVSACRGKPSGNTHTENGATTVGRWRAFRSWTGEQNVGCTLSYTWAEYWDETRTQAAVFPFF